MRGYQKGVSETFLLGGGGIESLHFETPSLIKENKVMKMWIITLLFLTCSEVSAQSWNRIFSKMKKIQYKELRKQFKDNPVALDFFKLYNSTREEIFYTNYLQIVENDTIFFLERYGDGENRYLLSTIWSKKTLLSYAGCQDSIKVEYNEICFPAYMMRLCSTWSIDAIRKEEEINATALPITYNCLTRVIISHNKYSIQCIFFRDFFLLNRDVNSHIYYRLGEYDIFGNDINFKK